MHQFGQAPLQAGVAQTTSAELLGSPDQVDACIPVGLAFPNQWKCFNVVSLSLQRAAQQGTGEILPMTVAEQQQSAHLRAPARPSL